MDADRAVTSAEETAALLAGSPFAERLARGAATIVAAGRPPRVLFANPAALTLFAAPDLAALEAQLFSPSSPGARRLTGLAEAAAAGPPRVELLRFWLGRRPLPVALLCGRIDDRLVLAAPPTPDEIRAAPPAPEPERAPPPRRFLWRLDGEERFGADRSGARGRLRRPRAASRRNAGGVPRPRRLRSRRQARRRAGGAPHLRRAADELGRRGRRSRRADVGRAGIRSRPPLRRLARISGCSPIRRRRASQARRPPRLGRAAAGRSRGRTAAEPRRTPPPPAPPVRPTPPAERSAEIVVLRPAAPPAAANVVPIRPGAMPPLPVADEPRRGGDDNVELSSHERDAFREIARALGARLPSRGRR